MTTPDMKVDSDLPDLLPTPTGWLATRDDFPRIGVMAPTRDEAERLFRTKREAWRVMVAR